MEEKEIRNLVLALEHNHPQIVTEYLGRKWKEGSNVFIDTITQMRALNSEIVDKYFNTHDSLMQFIK